ncbi:MAG: DsbE family thiol:disulfide interchange protein [Aquabacterium sp.]|uniref:DsbE family thiol:disulfide interchange protein n=1 Tax=Aquabacterium sp. TaxID=1872578 RepID=UPI003BDB98B5
MKRFLLPLGLFLALVSTLALGLKRHDPDSLPSPLMGKVVPGFSLSTLHDPATKVTPVHFKGQVWVLNAWASWCVSCRKEHPQLLALAQKKIVPIVGFNYQDQREAGLAWLQKHGNPYQVTVVDEDGRVGMDLGIIGIPETYVIDKKGVIRLKYAGAITPEWIEQTLLPLVKELQRG